MKAKRRSLVSLHHARSTTITTKHPKSRIDFDLPQSKYDDEDVISSEDEKNKMSDDADASESDEDETVDAKRIRLAKDYLERLRRDSDSVSDSSSGGSSTDSSEISDAVDRKLSRLRKNATRTERPYADDVASHLTDATNVVAYHRGHDLTPTCVTLAGGIAASGSKDHSVLMWDVERGVSTRTVVPQWKKSDRSRDRNTGMCLALALSNDGRYLVGGSKDGLVRVWDARETETKPVKEFKGHTAAVTSLAFRDGSLELFSGSEDRCLRYYNLDQMLYLETLYGHQSPVVSLACGTKACPISVARDRTVRAWKISDESHLIYRSGKSIGNAETVSAVGDDCCLTGHETGELLLWNTNKKKPLVVTAAAHGGSGVSACATVPRSDLALTGSKDGMIRLWKVRCGIVGTKEKPSVNELASVSVKGYINQIAVDQEARFCVIAVGQEHRLGRWDRVPNARNRFSVIMLRGDRYES